MNNNNNASPVNISVRTKLKRLEEVEKRLREFKNGSLSVGLEADVLKDLNETVLRLMETDLAS